MAKSLSKIQPPLYGLRKFSIKAEAASFYIERIKTHLTDRMFLNNSHKHDSYLLLYITHGGGEHTIDFKSYEASPGSFFLMTPGQVHSWKMKPDTDGYIIFFLKDFYHLQLTKNSLIEFPFFQSFNANPLIQLQPNEPSVNFILKDMHDEFTKSVSVTSLRIVRSYLAVLLLKLAQNCSCNSPDHNQDAFTNPATQKMRKLEQLIDKHYTTLKQPSEYADLMNMSPSYLNSICKQMIGQTLTDLISSRILLEAKRLFSYSDLSVNQVSEQLKFSSASYFIRFFKKHLGKTPEQFKESLHRLNNTQIASS
jgi:AraC family transcriptional regulator, transcriptional activator of pobA